MPTRRVKHSQVEASISPTRKGMLSFFLSLSRPQGCCLTGKSPSLTTWTCTNGGTEITYKSGPIVRQMFTKWMLGFTGFPSRSLQCARKWADTQLNRSNHLSEENFGDSCFLTPATTTYISFTRQVYTSYVNSVSLFLTGNDYNDYIRAMQSRHKLRGAFHF